MQNVLLLVNSPKNSNLWPIADNIRAIVYEKRSIVEQWRPIVPVKQWNVLWPHNGTFYDIIIEWRQFHFFSRHFHHPGRALAIPFDFMAFRPLWVWKKQNLAWHWWCRHLLGHSLVDFSGFNEALPSWNLEKSNNEWPERCLHHQCHVRFCFFHTYYGQNAMKWNIN